MTTAFRPLWLAALAGIVLTSIWIWSVGDKAPLDETWMTVSPESANMDAAPLQALDSVLAERGTEAWLVVRHGKIVHEWYRNGDGRRRYGAASMSKAMVGGLSLMLAMDDGMVALDDRASQYLPNWNDDLHRQSVIVRQLADHSSGLPQPREPEDLTADAHRWETAFWARSDDLIDVIETEAPILFEPGSDHGYSGLAYAVLSHILTRAMDGRPWRDLHGLLNERLMTPLGLHPKAWTIGYGGESFDVGGLDLYATWGGAAFTLRATARIGALMLNEGRWAEETLLTPQSVRTATRFDSARAVPAAIAEGRHPAPGLGWWSNEFGALPSLPKDAFLAAGAGHRVLIVVPSLDLILVRYGTRLGQDHWGGDYWQVLDQVLLTPVIGAIRDIETVVDAD